MNGVNNRRRHCNRFCHRCARDITKLSQNSRNRALSSLNRAASPSYLSFLPQIKSTPFELRHLSGLPLSPMVCKSEHRCHRQSVAVCDWLCFLTHLPDPSLRCWICCGSCGASCRRAGRLDCELILLKFESFFAK